MKFSVSRSDRVERRRLAPGGIETADSGGATAIVLTIAAVLEWRQWRPSPPIAETPPISEAQSEAEPSTAAPPLQPERSAEGPKGMLDPAPRRVKV